MSTKLFSVFIVVGLLVGLNGLQLPKPVHALSSIADINAGDLVRSDSLPAVYYIGEDGFRYVFPNSATYFTWYENFDNVKWISTADLGTIQIGGNVTYKPGVRMIKINSDPSTYAVDSAGTLRWVKTEAVATALYGANWNRMIDDIPDGFFPNYTIGSPIESASYFNKASASAVASINADKGLQSYFTVSVDESGYSNEALTIPAGRVVRWINDGSDKHTATADDLSWGTGTLPSGGHFSRAFKTAGVYTYFDSYNSQFTGTIIVQ